MTLTPSSIWTDITRIRETSPLVHSITNYVVMNTTANALLALGASPIMAHAGQEMDEIVNIADALVINIGTLSDPWIKSMFRAAEKAKELNIPIILDPVGAGATGYRTRTVRDLIKAVPPTIIRGNASEIMAISGGEARTKGVESTDLSEAAVDNAQQLISKTGSVICISGEIDYILGGDDIIKVKNGHSLMTRVTGMGCTATALCGAFAAVNDQFQVAAANAMTVMGITGEIAAEISHGTGSMQMNFLDTLYKLSKENMNRFNVMEE
ncbi:MAG: hydroxyethylthiazole kinase [Thermodesulfobacteriota bacterium]|nr:hydroxyethylthiazole kinase [Thermodesulfobacteriota bacterium]